MKKLNKTLVAMVMLVGLGISAFAGDMETTITSPTPAPPSPASSAAPTSATTDAAVLLAIVVVALSH